MSEQESSTERSTSIESSDEISEFYEDIKPVLNKLLAGMQSVVETGQQTSSLLIALGGTTSQIVDNNSKNNSILSEIQKTADTLRQNLDETIETTKDVVGKLDAQLARMTTLEDKLSETAGKIETTHGEVVAVKNNTDPKNSRKEAWKMLWHSVGWGTTASTIFGTAAGFALSKLTTPTEHCTNTHTETHIIEKVPVIPDKFILKNRKGRIVYRLTAIATHR